jgi:hypothetical protein
LGYDGLAINTRLQPRISTPYKNILSGENRASGCERFGKTCCFRHSETIDLFQKK